MVFICRFFKNVFWFFIEHIYLPCCNFPWLSHNNVLAAEEIGQCARCAESLGGVKCPDGQVDASFSGARSSEAEGESATAEVPEPVVTQRVAPAKASRGRQWFDSFALCSTVSRSLPRETCHMALFKPSALFSIDLHTGVRGSCISVVTPSFGVLFSIFYHSRKVSLFRWFVASCLALSIRRGFKH